MKSITLLSIPGVHATHDNQEKEKTHQIDENDPRQTFQNRLGCSPAQTGCRCLNEKKANQDKGLMGQGQTNEIHETSYRHPRNR